MELWAGAGPGAEGEESGRASESLNVRVWGKGWAPLAGCPGVWPEVTTVGEGAVSLPTEAAATSFARPLPCPFSFGVKGRGWPSSPLEDARFFLPCPSQTRSSCRQGLGRDTRF